MSASTHKAVVTSGKGVFEEIQLPTPDPKQDEVLVKVEYSSAVAFDVYFTDALTPMSPGPMTLGLSSAGVVARVGPGVDNLKVGDRVATFGHGFVPPEKAMQEYALLKKYGVSKIPDSLPLPEAAAIPDGFVTAYWVLFASLRLPLPESFPVKSPPPEASTPILIYGSGTASGQSMIQVLKLAGYKRIIATASPKHHDYLKSLGATDVFDYSRPDLAKSILAATGGKPVKYAVDCVSAETTIKEVSKVVGKGSIVVVLVPIKPGSAVTAAPGSAMWMEIPAESNPFSEGVEIVGASTFSFQENEVIKETMMPKVLPKLLAEGLVSPPRVRLIKDGSLKHRVETALDLLRNNKVSGEKVILKFTE